MKEFTGKVAVVTGAASGIGRALAERFAREGMKVVLADIELNAAREVEKQLVEAGSEAISVRCDVTQADSVADLAAATLDAFGKVHVVCNNAGVFAGGVSWESPVSDYEWVLGVNTWGVIHGIRTFIPILLEQGEECHVVNTASMAGVTSAAFTAAYYMSKHAVMALSESVFLELKAKEASVGVSVLCPEVISTGISRSERNRPEHLKRPDGEEHPEQDFVEGAIDQMISSGLNPSVMADRVVAAIRENRFYILSEEGGSWRQACNQRLDDLRLGRNPSGAQPGLD